MTSANRNLTWKLGIQDNASSGFSKVADNSESMGERISGAFSKVGDAIGGEIGEIVNKAGEGFEKISEAGSGTWTKIAAGGAVAAGIGVALQSMASSGQAAEAQLKVAVDNTGDSFDDYEDKISKAEAAGAKFGDTSTQVAGALQILVQATGDTDTAISDLNVAYDLAAAKHISLSDAAALLAKVYAGSTKTLTQYGVTMKVTAGNTGEAANAIQALSDKISGQANASVDNFQGHVNQAKAEIEDWGEKIASFAGGPLTYIGTGIGIASGVIDIFAAKAERAAAKELELAAATDTEAASAKTSTGANVEAAASQDALAASADKATESQGASKLASAGAVGGLAAFAVGAYYAGNAVSNLIEKNNSAVKVMNNIGSTLETLDEAYQKDGNNIGQYTNQVLQSSLQQDGLAGKAAKAGISLDELSTGVSGSTDTFNELVNAWKAGGKPSDDTIAALATLHVETTDLKGSNNSLATSVDGTSTAVNGLATAAENANPPVMSLSDAMGILGGNALSAEQAANSFKDSLDAVSQSVKTNGRSLNDNTTAGRANEESVLSAITEANNHAEAVYKQTNSVQQASAALAADEAALKQNATQNGLTAAAVQGLLNKYAAVPADIQTTLTLNDSQALSQLNDDSAAISAYMTKLNSTDPTTAAFLRDQAEFQARDASGGQLSFAASGRQLGGWTEVGEYGTEGISPTGYVMPHGQWEQKKRSAAASSGGGDTHIYNITIAGAVGPNAEFQRIIVGALEDHTAQGGRMRIAAAIN